jgi:hypothetical protein
VVQDAQAARQIQVAVRVVTLHQAEAAAVQVLSLFAMLTLLLWQHQQQAHQQLQHQVVIEFTNGQEAGA